MLLRLQLVQGAIQPTEVQAFLASITTTSGTRREGFRICSAAAAGGAEAIGTT